MQQTKTTTRDAGVQATLEGIHRLYQAGKIDRDTHNRWCQQACAGSTIFEF